MSAPKGEPEEIRRRIATETRADVHFTRVDPTLVPCLAEPMIFDRALSCSSHTGGRLLCLEREQAWLGAERLGLPARWRGRGDGCDRAPGAQGGGLALAMGCTTRTVLRAWAGVRAAERRPGCRRPSRRLRLRTGYGVVPMPRWRALPCWLPRQTFAMD